LYILHFGCTGDLRTAAVLQVNNTIAELEGLRRRSEQDEAAAAEAAKAAATARGQARKMRCEAGWCCSGAWGEGSGAKG
jgi:hypothetical protein